MALIYRISDPSAVADWHRDQMLNDVLGRILRELQRGCRADPLKGPIT